jgi:hypothetical protein
MPPIADVIADIRFVREVPNKRLRRLFGLSVFAISEFGLSVTHTS